MFLEIRPVRGKNTTVKNIFRDNNFEKDMVSRRIFVRDEIICIFKFVSVDNYQYKEESTLNCNKKLYIVCSIH